MSIQELIRFIQYTREMCGEDRLAISAAMNTLYAVLQRQHAQPKVLAMVRELTDFDSTGLIVSSKPIKDESALRQLVDKAAAARSVREAHRGCR